MRRRTGRGEDLMRYVAMEEPARLIKHVIGLPWCFDVNYRPGKKKHLLLNVVGLQAPWTGWRPSR